MNWVDAYTLKKARGPLEIRWALHNIMEWGTRDRERQNQKLVDVIKARIKRDKDDMHAKQAEAKEQVKAAKAATKVAKGTAKGSSAEKLAPTEKENGNED